ncbi:MULTISPECIES: tRNA adenosine(34) deaminase TadA [Acidaminococcus]|uniref:tRNA adenosine(34) deaminase TadA n=1 Tax=Acidaminococcus TaxID=904 RepID=UPI00266FDE02|nr:tRNA adenosine(34) deaminase TadA [Acidaminococcus fermentans]MEE1599165.1 tRNA adenosine(34) deaminase TadA [Acidaminococcus fermentans]MEE4123427.1 tRNA adenosine(34) deaminase TadA [Acidaminococcus fermentans]
MAQITKNSLAGQTDVHFMEMALEEARQAAREGEIPVGAVLVREGQVLARNHNRREQDRDATAHAEVLVLREACRQLGRWRLSDTALYVTLEPCPMCAGAIWNARVGRLVYGAWDSAAGACGSQFNLPAHPSLNFRTQVTAGVMEEECRKILQDFLKARR